MNQVDFILNDVTICEGEKREPVLVSECTKTRLDEWAYASDVTSCAYHPTLLLHPSLLILNLNY